MEEIAQIKPHRSADKGTDQRAEAADHRLHDQLSRSVEGERLGRHIALQHPEQSAGEAGIGCGDDEGEQLIGVDVVADRGRAQGIVADGDEDAPDRRGDDPAGQDEADEIANREKNIHRPSAGHMNAGEAEIERRSGHARQAVLAAGIVGQGRVLHEEEHLGDRDRDHGEIDAGAPERDHADEKAGDRGRDDADRKPEHHAGQPHAGQKIGGDETAGAEERRLAERQQPGEAEQKIEADAEQPEHQNPIHGVGDEADLRQDEGRDDERERRPALERQPANSPAGLDHVRPVPARRADRAGERQGQTS